MLMLCAVKEAEPRLANCAFMGTRDEVAPSIQSIMANPLLSDAAIQKAAASLREHASLPSAQVLSQLVSSDVVYVFRACLCAAGRSRRRSRISHDYAHA
jgi:hypothetical protein